MSNPPTQPPKTGQPTETDPLASLYKMSRTAGLGTGEYVAVNATAVVAMLLGLASASAVLGTVMLVVPLAAVIVSVIAIIQIRRSAGTETGQGLAILGLLLAAGFVATVGGRAVLHARQISQEQDQIVALIDQLGKNISQEKYDAAWEQFGPVFHERVKKQAFEDTLRQNQANPLHGHIDDMRWNGILDVEIDSDTKFAHGFVILDLSSGQQKATYRLSATFRKTEQGWVVEDLEGYFPMAPLPQPQAG